MTSEGPAPAGVDGTPAVPEEQADQAAADLDALRAHRRRSTRRAPRHELSPERVAGRFVEVEANRARFMEHAGGRFFDAMEPVEREEFMTQLAGKLTDVAAGHIQGAVATFNDVRAHFNARRLALGEAALPPVELNSASMRAMLRVGIEEGLEAGLRLVLETALHALFGEPPPLPRADAASSLESLPALEEPEGVFNLHWSQRF